MPQTPILVPARLRRPPKTGWSWVDRRFLREHTAHLSRDAVLLYFFLCAVADKHGLSFYGDGTWPSWCGSYRAGLDGCPRRTTGP